MLHAEEATLWLRFHDFWIDMSNRETKSMEGWKAQAAERAERKELHRELRKSLSALAALLSFEGFEVTLLRE